MFAQMDINFHDLSQILGVDVYSYDYTGYGFSTGTPSEKNIYDDISTFYSHILETRPNVKVPIIY